MEANVCSGKMALKDSHDTNFGMIRVLNQF